MNVCRNQIHQRAGRLVPTTRELSLIRHQLTFIETLTTRNKISRVDEKGDFPFDKTFHVQVLCRK